MSLLKSIPLSVGDQTFVLSEFTALDRLTGLEYQINYPAPVLPEDPDEEAINYHRMALEVYSLNMITHSLAVSLKHANEAYQSLTIKDIQTEVKERWPNNIINQAYAELVNLNTPPQTADSVSDDQESPTPEKS